MPPQFVTVINKPIYGTPCIDCGCTCFLVVDSKLFCELCGKKSIEPYKEENDDRLQG